MKNGSMVRITDEKWIGNLQIEDCVGWEGEDESMIAYCRKLASGLGEITDEYFEEYPAVWVTFGSELMLAVPKTILECVDEKEEC